jgi:hypothetical protein
MIKYIIFVLIFQLFSVNIGYANPLQTKMPKVIVNMGHNYVKIDTNKLILKGGYTYLRYRIFHQDTLKTQTYNNYTLRDTTFKVKNKKHNAKMVYFKDIPDVKMLSYDFSEERLLSKREFLFMFGNTYSIDSLYYMEKYSNKKEPFRYVPLHIDKIYFHNKVYIAFYVTTIFNSSSNSDIYILLFDITDTNKIIYIHTIDFQYADNTQCFGDFDNDKQLDFIWWAENRTNGNVMKLYNLVENRFIFNKNYYIWTDKIYIKEILFELISLKKSKWFFDIRNGYFFKK